MRLRIGKAKQTIELTNKKSRFQTSMNDFKMNKKKVKGEKTECGVSVYLCNWPVPAMAPVVLTTP